MLVVEITDAGRRALRAEDKTESDSHCIARIKPRGVRASMSTASTPARTGDVNLNAYAGRRDRWHQPLRRARRCLFGAAGHNRLGSIASGLTLLDLSSSLRYMITGAVLAIAVVVGSLARRLRVSHDRALISTI